VRVSDELVDPGDQCAGCAAHYQCCGTVGREAARLDGRAARAVLICSGRRGGSGVHRRDGTAKGQSGCSALPGSGACGRLSRLA
jgi:Tfp pilus tip-associated adhesin PilY1